MSNAGFSNFYFVSGPPVDVNKPAALKFEIENGANNKGNPICSISALDIPDLKVGTLDSLVSLSDDIVKIDAHIDGVVRKLAYALQNLLIEHPEKLEEALTIEGVSLNASLEKFSWDGRKYFLKNSTRDIVDDISRRVGEIDAELKKRNSEYQKLKTSLSQIERSQTGSLLSKSLTEIIKREHVVLNSEYLTTLFVVVPTNNESEWLEKYSKLTDMVVPNSSQKITNDGEYSLYSVTLFKRIADEFKNAARENKFVVRDFTYDPEQLEKNKQDLRELSANVTRQWASLVRWARANFAEAYSCWSHIKIVTVFVESVLRFGLPPTFECFLVQPFGSKLERKTRQMLLETFSHLKTKQYDKHNAQQTEEMIGFSGTGEYFPYVSLTVNNDFLTTKKR